MATFEPNNVDAFLSGAIGQPGQRTFFLQVAGDGSLVSLKCEKQHVATLVEALQALLRDLPPVDPTSVPELGGLRSPVLAEWVLGPMGLGYESSSDRIVILMKELIVGPAANNADPDDEDDEVDDINPENATVRFSITRAQARAFIDQGSALVAAGRAACPVCATPVDADGYNCACFN
jgi:uncharacterized repeat protein (TIGR03847 family)